MPSTSDYVSEVATKDECSPLSEGAVAGEAVSRSRGRFTILQPHAKGGLGQVSLARDEQLHRPVALKEIRPDRFDSPSARERFWKEAEITGQLEHPGIVPIYALEEDAAGQPYYAMRFIQGKTLQEAIQQFHGRAAGVSPPVQEPVKEGIKERGGADNRPAPAGRSPYQGADAPRSPDFASLAFRDLLKRFVDVCQTMAYAHS